MTTPRALLHAALAGVGSGIDRVDDLFALGEGHGDRVRLVAYAGYRDAARVRLRGRVLRFEEPLKPAARFTSRLRALIATYNSAELAGVAVRIDGYGRTAETVSDAEGYFAFEFAIPDMPLPSATAWETVTLTAPGRQAQAASVPAAILAPGTDGHWGVISDIDDTVIETGATDLVANWRRILLHAPSERPAVPGAASLYRAIARDHAAPARPFFYVSSSPWNLYGFLAEFMELNAIPHGAMFLKDWGIDRETLFMASHDAHKLAAIRDILAFYPGFRFLLVGDNGERDVDIYSTIVAEFGARVAGVFIRDVSGTCREGTKAELLRGIEAAGVPTYCGEGFDDALAVFSALQLNRPEEAAKAVAEPEPHG